MGIFEKLKAVAVSQLNPEFAAKLGVKAEEAPKAAPAPSPLGLLKRAEAKYSPYWPQRPPVTPPALQAPAPAPSPAAAPPRLAVPPRPEFAMPEFTAPLPPTPAPLRGEILPGMERARPPTLEYAPEMTLPERPRALESLRARPAEAPSAAPTPDVESLLIEIRATRDQNRLILERIARIEEMLRRLGY